MARTKGKVTGTAEDSWVQLIIAANPTYALRAIILTLLNN